MPITLLPHQIKPADYLLDFLKSPRKGTIIIGETGVGKTFVLAGALAYAQKEGFLKKEDIENPLKVCSILMLTPKNCIIQQQRAFYKAGIKHFIVTSLSTIASSGGALFIDWKEAGHNKKGDAIYEPFWSEETKPDVIVLDECQQAKNPASKRTQVIHAAIKQGIKIIFMSATPFSKACEASTVVVGCEVIKSFDNFDQYSWAVAPAGPTLNSPKACERIRNDLIAKNAFIEITGAKYPFKAKFNNILLNLTDEQRFIYDKAYEDYLEVLRKEGRNGPRGIFAIWVAQNKFREAADILKAEMLAKRAFQVVNHTSPRQVIIASNYIAALNKIWTTLKNELGVSSTRISVLFGGQNLETAQKQIDSFQENFTQYFLTTIKSGGVGLNLHHESVHAFPRYVLLPPTWSIYEYVQMAGRAQRITSLSQTIQETCWYRDTIEEKVMRYLDEKGNCLRALLSKSENYIHKIFNNNIEIDEAAYEAKIKEENKNEDNEDGEEDIDTGMLD